MGSKQEKEEDQSLECLATCIFQNMSLIKFLFFLSLHGLPLTCEGRVLVRWDIWVSEHVIHSYRFGVVCFHFIGDTALEIAIENADKGRPCLGIELTIGEQGVPHFGGTPVVGTLMEEQSRNHARVKG